MSPAHDPERTAARLLRLYPRSWRARYGAEFSELLAADIAERPRCWRRAADVIRAATLARLASAGLAADPVVAPRCALTTVGVATLGFVGIASSLWVQLLGGSLESTPDSAAARIGATVLTLTGGLLAGLAVLALLPLAPALVRAARRRGTATLRWPAGLVLAGLSILAAGGHHFAGRWPAAAGQHDELVSRVGGYCWAETLGISTFWAHPHRLFALPTDELTWMWVSPLAVLAVVVGLIILVRRISVSDAVRRFEAWLAAAAAIGMAPALAAATAWVVSSQGDPNATFRAGTLDLLLVAGMTAAVAATGMAVDRIRRPVEPVR